MRLGTDVLRRLYGLLMWLAQPLLRRKLARRARVEALYGQHIEERFGYYRQTLQSSGVRSTFIAENQEASAKQFCSDPDHPTDSDCLIWIHAVSLGETRAAAILLEALRRALPGMRLLLTCGTATGRAEGVRLLQAGDVQVWQPWDTPAVVGRFLDHFKPRLGLLLETEIWPNWVHGCAARGLPLLLVNARLSEKSLQRAQRLAGLARPAYRALAGVLAQTDADAARLRTLGAPVQGVLGNLKFDARPDATLCQRGRDWHAALQQPLLLLASSREGEEAELLQILKQNPAIAPVGTSRSAIKTIAKQRPTGHWLIVPRHPQRFDAVAALIEQHGFAVARRSSWGDAPPVAAPMTIWLGDSLGEMALYYSFADVALLGGSFAALGGQNLIEAAACGCPVLMGPHTFNFTQAAQQAEQAGAARRAADLASAVQQASDWLGDPLAYADARRAALRFAEAHRGAAQRTAERVAARLLTLPRSTQPQACP